MPHKESFFYHLVRKFFGSFASFLGFFIAFLIFVCLLGYSMGGSSPATESMLPMKVKNARTGYEEHLAKNSAVILQINIEDVIGKSSNPLGSSKMVSKILQQPTLYGIKKDRIKGIMIHINSPGGGVYDSDSIYTSIMDYKQKMGIPVHAWTNNLCASGGYYIACASDYISADTITIIGSVGVISPPKFNFYKAMQEYGISQTTVSAGKNKQHFPMFSPMPKGTESYNDFIVIINTFYDKFLDIVSNARSSKGLTQDKLRELGATVYMSEEAQRLGYIDAANVQYQGAINHFIESMELKNRSIQVVSYEHKASFIESLKSKFESKFSFLFGDDDKNSLPCRYEMNYAAN
ncbi:MAG: hypothetical protein S4CHLAM20_12510 [Chlamydiia bacterium]|nr:hypothetical protein [Chlamydiia bacterium]